MTRKEALMEREKKLHEKLDKILKVLEDLKKAGVSPAKKAVKK